jgi:hypothetical protein
VYCAIYVVKIKEKSRRYVEKGGERTYEREK